MGKDVTTLGTSGGLGQECAVEAGGVCFTAPFSPGQETFKDCKLLLRYGFSGCSKENLYLAGAIRQCGGLNKMPTQADLTNLAKELYTDQLVTSEDDVFGILDTSKAFSLGFDDDFFGVLAADGSVRIFNCYHTTTEKLNYATNRRVTSAMCIGD